MRYCLAILFVLFCSFTHDSRNLSVIPKAYTYQNFKNFVETDTTSDIFVNSGTLVTVTTLPRDTDSNLQKDYGVNYFGDFEHKFEFTKTAWSGNAANVPTGVIYCLSNVAGWTLNVGGGVLSLKIVRDATGSYLQVQDGFSGSALAITIGQKYYVTVRRFGSKVTAQVFSDNARTSLLATYTATTSTQCRYLTVAAGRDTTTSGSDISYTIENFQMRNG